MARPAIPGAWQGLWRSVGYNRILDIRQDGYSLYTASAGHASVAERGSVHELGAAFDRIRLDERGRLALHHAHDLTRYEFERWRSWDARCTRYESPCEDIAANFSAFREVFAENYAFFERRGVDWAGECAALEPRVASAPSLEALAGMLECLIAALADLHVYVATPARRLRSARARGPRAALQAALGLPTPTLSARSSVDAIAARLPQTLLAGFADTLRNLRRAGNDVITWGTLRPGIGYLALLRMFGFAPSAAARRADDLPHRLSEAGPFMGADMMALERILEDAIRELSAHDALIIDARLNGGGFDRAGMLLCERLIDEPCVAYTKKARFGNGFTEPQALTLTPARGPRFLKSVFLLTSAFTVSAGEVFALAMSALPRVTLLGEPTQGILSDNLFHRLPCLWEVSLSNERYESVEGCCYEAHGVPPDEPLPMLGAADPLSDLRAGLAIAVERAGRV